MVRLASYVNQPRKKLRTSRLPNTLKLCTTMAVNPAKGIAMTVQTIPSTTETRAHATEPERPEFPVREYIGAMATELAQMALWDGDETLGQMLDSAAALAADTPLAAAVEVLVEEPRRGRAT